MSRRLLKEELQALCDTAICAAQEAGQWVKNYDRRSLQRAFKNSGSSAASQIVTQVDVRSEEIIRKHLAPASELFDIAFVGEESSFTCLDKSNERFEKPYFWCIDPLDGTLAFFEGRSGYAVSISLVEKSGKPLLGVVYDPSRNVLLHAIHGQGSYQNLNRFSRSAGVSNKLMVFADQSFRTHQKYKEAVAVLKDCARALCLDGVTFLYGSGAVQNACQVIDSWHACYVKLPKKKEGGGSIWDFSATACIASEAGTWVSNIHGQPLALNRRDSTFMNYDGVIFASNEIIAQYLINAFMSR